MNSRLFRILVFTIALVSAGLAVAACQTSDADDSVASAVNQANQAAQNAATAAQQASMAAKDTTAVTVAEEAKLAAMDAATAAQAAASAAQEASAAAKQVAGSAMTVSTEVVKGDPGSLVVYSGRSESLVGPVIEQFAEATGIDVKVKYGSTFEVAATLLEEGPNSPADVFFAQDPGGLGAVSELLSSLPGDVVLRVPEWARSSDGSWGRNIRSRPCYRV